MTITIRTRKPVYKIIANDLLSFAIWEFALDEEPKPGQNEAWVRPVPIPVIRRNVYSQIVATDFITPLGRHYVGLSNVTTAKSIDVYPIALFCKGRYCYVPMISRKVALRKISTHWIVKEWIVLYKKLGIKERDIIPLRYILRTLIKGENTYRTGAII
jgi:hypothetical protein